MKSLQSVYRTFTQLVALLFLCVSFSYAQQAAYTKHTVAKGETVTQIALRYAITPYDIYRLNPDSQTGIKENDVLLLPKSVQATPTKTVSQPRIVQPKETWYSLSKEAGLSVEELMALNPNHPDLKIGDTVRIAAVKSPDKSTKVPTTTAASALKHLVQAKETKFGIAQKYGLTVAELEQQNPSILSGLQEGAELLISLPPAAKPTMTSAVAESVATPLVKASTKLVFTKPSAPKKLVLVLPFNAAKITADTLTTLANRLKKDVFLNYTLDFYTGALVAIDSVKSMGINIDVQVLDSEETKNSSAIEALLKANRFQGASAVIGPFYQQNVDKVASALQTANVPVLSPLSKEIGKPNAVLYQTVPSIAQQKQVVLDYMTAQKGNIVLVSDPKKVTSKNWITQHYPSVKLAKFSETGGLDLVFLKSLLQKNTTNYVVLDTQKTNVILSVLGTLTPLMPSYTLQLAIVEPNETLDYEEISLQRLADLHLLYPSVTRENNSIEAQHFRNQYKAINKVFPNPYAVRGFDLTFDTLLRLAQEGNFASTSAIPTQQVESKFMYTTANNLGEGYRNSGVYVLQFQSDLTSKQLNE